MPGNQARALQRMKDRGGLHILAGSAANAVSYEASRFGHGVLTYSLLDGMRGAAVSGDDTWDVHRLFEHATRAVPRLARGLGGIQRPVVASPSGGGSFALGLAPPEVRAHIRLNQALPFLERVILVDPRLRDPLDLVRKVHGRLRTAADKPDAPFAFVDEPNLDGYALVGQYQRQPGDRGMLVLTASLLYAEKTVAEERFQAAPGEIAEQIADWAERMIHGRSGAAAP
ncbi:MAG: hypothetical protein ACI9WU_001682 [Myxococcota bacterium]